MVVQSINFNIVGDSYSWANAQKMNGYIPPPTQFVDATGASYSPSGFGTTQLRGYRVSVNNNCKLVKMTIEPNSNTSIAYLILHSDGSIIEQSNIVDNEAVFNSELTAGTVYRMQCGHTSQYASDVATLSWPINGTNINFDYGLRDGDDRNNGYNIVSVTTE